MLVIEKSEIDMAVLLKGQRVLATSMIDKGVDPRAVVLGMASTAMLLLLYCAEIEDKDPTDLIMTAVNVANDLRKATSECDCPHCTESRKILERGRKDPSG